MGVLLLFCFLHEYKFVTTVLKVLKNKCVIFFLFFPNILFLKNLSSAIFATRVVSDFFLFLFYSFSFFLKWSSVIFATRVVVDFFATIWFTEWCWRIKVVFLSIFFFPFFVYFLWYDFVVVKLDLLTKKFSSIVYIFFF